MKSYMLQARDYADSSGGRQSRAVSEILEKIELVGIINPCHVDAAREEKEKLAWWEA